MWVMTQNGTVFVRRVFAYLKDPKFQDRAALLILLVAGILFYAVTYNRSSYSYILRADEGVSLATSLRVTEGFVPQRDFPSYYGPLMPYLYGGFFAVVGPSIALMRALWAGLYILSIILFYCIGKHLMPVFAAFAAAAIMIGQQHTPLYTYNHIGFTLATGGILLLLFQRISGTQPRYFRARFAALLAVTLLIKFNEGLAIFGVLAATVWILGRASVPQNQSDHFTSMIKLRDLIIPGTFALGIFAIVSVVLNAGLTKSQFLRNFPVLPEYQAGIGGYHYVKLILSVPFNTPWHQMTARRWYVFWYENYAFAIVVSFVVGVLVLFCALRFVSSKRYRARIQRHWKAALLLVVAIGTYHEFYLTGNHWSTPMYIGFSVLALACFIWAGLSRFPKIRIAILSGLLTLCAASDVYYITIVRQTYSQYHFAEPRAEIYSSDDSDAPIIAEVTRFLESTVPPVEPLAAFPHDALLIYLSGHQNAMRDDDYQWMLFPTRESDLEIAQELERKKVPKILLSNFVGIRHGQPAVFGKDYLPETFQFIRSHYRVMKIFGSNPRRYQVQYLELVDPAKATPDTP